jgi:hypothetical protein
MFEASASDHSRGSNKHPMRSRFAFRMCPQCFDESLSIKTAAPLLAAVCTGALNLDKKNVAIAASGP